MKLSIITVCYNNKIGLIKTADSILKQTLHEFEWIIIDGGSKDGSKEIIERLSVISPECVSYWCSEPDNGIYNAMNKGVKVATGDYLLFLNSGDIFYDDKVIEQVAPNLEDVDFVFGNHCYVSKYGKIRDSSKWPKILPKEFWIARTINHQSMFIKRSTLVKTPYDESLKVVADWAHPFYWLAIKNGSYKVIDTIVAIAEEGGYSFKHGDILAEERQRIIEKYFSKRESDEMVLSFLAQNTMVDSFLLLSEKAIFSYFNKRYSPDEFTKIFKKYSKQICTHGTFMMRLLNWLNIHHLMMISDILCKVIYRKK